MITDFNNLRVSHSSFPSLYTDGSRHRREEAETSLRIILLLQLSQLLLPPCLAPVPLTGRLVAISVIDIGALHLPPCSLMENVTEVVAELGGLGIQLRRSVGHVRDERGGEDVLVPVSVGRGVAVDLPDALGGVAFEHEEGVVEGGGPGDRGGVVVVGFSEGRRVVGGQVDGEAGIYEPFLLAGGLGEGDARPGGEVGVVAGLGVDLERADVVEGFCVGFCYLLDSFLDDVKDNDGLKTLHVNEKFQC